MSFIFLIGVAWAAVVEVLNLVSGDRLDFFEGPKNVRELKQMIEEREGIPVEFIEIIEEGNIKSDDDMLDSEIDCTLNMLAKTPPDLENALYNYAKSGEVKTVKYILRYQQDIDVVYAGETALMVAAWEGHEGVAKVLLEAKADKEKTSDDGETVLMITADRGKEGVAKVLLEANAELDKQDNDGWSALMHAAHDNSPHGDDQTLWANEGVAKLLLEAKADKEKKSNDGFTPLMRAARWGNVGVVKVLLEAKADKEKKSNDGYTALMHAENPRPGYQIGAYKRVVKLLTN